METRILIFAIAFFMSGMIRGQIIHVPGDQATIQDGINFASNGDTVLVDAGTYFENIRFFGKAITVASGYIMDGDTSHISNTIIDGSQPEDPNFGSVVTFMNGEDTTSILNGFTITGGTGLEIESSQMMGGGIACYQSGAKIINNRIVNNEISYAGVIAGGGISCLMDIGEAWVIIEDNTVSGNSCISVAQAFGGGIAVGTHARVMNNTIHNNHCNATASNGFTAAGGLYIDSPYLLDSVFVKSNDISHNTIEAYYCYGAGIYAATSFSDLSDNTITYNSTLGTMCYGSAVIIRNIDGVINIENNLINENTHSSVSTGAATIWISYVQNTDSRVTIKNNTINNNSASGTGAALQGTAIFLSKIINLEVIIDANIIKNNQSGGGAGFWAQNSYNYTLTNNVFTENRVENLGGAIYSKQISSKNVSNLPFPMWSSPSTSEKLKNTKKQKKRGLFRPLIANNTFVGNHSDDLGGAVYLASTYDSLCPVFINNIFYENTADGMDYEIHHAGDEELLISNNNIDISKIFGNWDGTGNIEGDPNFSDTLFHINGAPCFQAGIDSVLHDDMWYYCPATDYEGDPRPYDGFVDIGADEYLVPVGIALSDVTIEKSKIVNYPNPFATSATIEYQLDQPSEVTLTIFNHLGKQVDLINQYQQTGKQSITWKPQGLTPGMYFFTLKAGEQVATGKMVKMR